MMNQYILKLLMKDSSSQLGNMGACVNLTIASQNVIVEDNNLSLSSNQSDIGMK